MEAFGKRLQKQESKLTIKKAVAWQTIHYLCLTDILVMSYEMINNCLSEILSSSHVSTLCPGCVPQLPEDLPRNLSTVLNLLWENRRSEIANYTTDGPQVCWKQLPLQQCPKSLPAALHWVVKSWLNSASHRAPTQTRVMYPTLFSEYTSRQCSQLQGWILQVDSGKVLNNTLNED